MDNNQKISTKGAAKPFWSMDKQMHYTMHDADIRINTFSFWTEVHAKSFSSLLVSRLAKHRALTLVQIIRYFFGLSTVFIGYLYLTKSPLNSVQLLWNKFIMDTFAALALET